MRVLMKETHKGSEDGITIREYQAGEAYEISLDLASIFLNLGVAEKIDSKPGNSEASNPPAERAVDPKPEGRAKGKK